MNLDLTSCVEFTEGNNRCLLPAEVQQRYVLESTDGGIEHIRTRCLGGHTLSCASSEFAGALLELSNSKTLAAEEPEKHLPEVA